jgi:hypothetical protein
MRMPKDWARDETAILKYCDCEFTQIKEGTTVSEEDITHTTDDGRAWKLVRVHSDCKLHGDDPSHDLPDSI